MAIREIEVNIPHKNVNFPDHAYAHELLDNLQGVELGPSSHNSFHLPGSIAVAPKDNFDFYKTEGQARYNGKYCEIDIWGEASKISVPNKSQGYVISSHVIEHIPDLVRAFQEWERILVNGGYVFMIVPQRDALDADQGRDLSTLDNVLTAYNDAWTPDTVPENVNYLAGGWRGHYWVFTSKSFKDIIIGLNERDLLNWELIHEEDPDLKVGNGFCLVYKSHLRESLVNDLLKNKEEYTLPNGGDVNAPIQQSTIEEAAEHLAEKLQPATPPKKTRKKKE